MTDKKYKVCDGVTITTKGIAFNAGDSIPCGVLSDDSVKMLLAAKKIFEENAQSNNDMNGENTKKAEKTKKDKEKKARFIKFTSSANANFVLNLASLIINFISLIVKK